MYIIYFLLFLFAWLWYETTHYKKVETIIELPDIQREYHLIQISDVHSNSAVHSAQLAEDIAKQKPELILLTGDLIDRRDKNLETIQEFITDLKSLNVPLIFVKGNHEEASPLREEFISWLKAQEVHFLGQQDYVLGELTLMGMDIYEKPILKDQGVKVLVGHNPFEVWDYAEQVDLMICGHTHGGQVRLPWIGAIKVPGQGLFPKYSRGLYALKNSQLYIDSGLGNTFLPLRFFCRIQYSSLKIIPKSDVSRSSWFA